MNKTKNPFPSKAIATADRAAMQQSLKTLITEAIQRAANLAIEYYETESGQIITISGPYGSGKTHLLMYTYDLVRRKVEQEGEDRRTVQVYIKAENDSFISLHQQFIRQIDHPLMRELNVRFLGDIARREFEEKIKASQSLLDKLSDKDRQEILASYDRAREETKQTLRTKPDDVYKYLDKLIVQPEKVLKIRSETLVKDTGENFKKAFFYLDDINLGQIAFDWFAGVQLSDRDRRKLGVTQNLNSADEAKFTLRLLITLFRKANIPLLVYIDQLNKLLLDTAPDISKNNAGQIQTLVEIFARENAFVAISATKEAWNTMSRDFASRIGPTQIEIEQISPSMSVELVKTYLPKDEEETSRDTASSDIFPFTFDGIRKILSMGGGNMRRFLQNCHTMYEEYLSSGSSIDETLVQEILPKQSEQYDQKKVAEEITKILRQKRLQFVQNHGLFRDFKPDFLIGKPNDPQIVIEISESLFYFDEAKSALKIVDLKGDLSRNYPQAKLMIIPIGYVSTEVLEYLERLGENCLVYEDDLFSAKFESAIDRLLAEKPYSESSNLPQLLNQEIQEIKDSIEKLVRSRKSELEELNNRLEKLQQQQEQRLQGIQENQEREWRNWITKHRQLWEKNQEKLKVQQKEERESLQKQGIRSRFMQAIPSSIGALVVSLSFPLGFYIFISFFFINKYEIIYQARGALSLCLSILLLIFFYFPFFHEKIFPLGGATDSIAKFSGDLAQLAQKVESYRNISQAKLKNLIEVPDPNIRYLAAQICLARPDLDIINFKRASDETWIPLYLEFLKLSLKNAKRKEDIVDHFNLLLKGTPENPRTIYAISTFADESSHIEDKENLLNSSDLINIAEEPNYEKVLSHAIFEGVLDPSVLKSKNLPTLAQFACIYKFPELDKQYPTMATLVERFRKTGRLDDSFESSFELDFTIDQIQTTIKVLSPHQKKGLASFKDLQISNLYLRIYRFFAEIDWRYQRNYITLKT